MSSYIKKRPTISDVARLAHVSTATVSRALQNPDMVSDETRKKVFEIVTQTGYRANTAARILRQNRASTLLVMLPDIANPFFSEILSGIEDAATEHNFTILIGNTNGEEARAQDLLGSLRNGRADGALLLNGKLPLHPDEIATLPLVSISETIPNTKIGHVATDSVAATYEATQHLIDLGHKRIVHLSGPQGNVLTQERSEGYELAMRAAGLGDHIKIIPCGFTVEDGQRSVACMLRMHSIPDAITCASDVAAMGAIVELRNRGITVPDKVSVVGFDDIEFAKIFAPPLTTIRQNRKELGRRATLMLLGLINGTILEAENIVIGHMLIRRGSAIAAVNNR